MRRRTLHVPDNMALPDSPPAAIDYHALFRALPDAFLLFGADPDGTILDNTDQHEAISLKKRADVVGKPFFDAWPPVDQNEAEAIRASHDYVRRTRTAHQMPVIRYDLQDSVTGQFVERYWQATHYPILDDQGELRYLLQRTRDITEQYHAEQRRRAAEAALTEQQQLNSFTLDALPLIVWITTAAGVPTYLNRCWFSFTGETSLRDTHTDATALIHPDDVASVTACWQQAAINRTECQFEYRLRRHDGQYRWMLGRTVPRLDDAGQVVQWIGCATDIHDQKRLVEDLLRTSEEQEQFSEQAYRAHRVVQSQREAFYALFMSMPVAICILRGPDHRFEFANPSYQQLTNHRAKPGLTVAEALPEVVKQGFIELLNRVYDSGEPFFGREVRIELEGEGFFLDFTYQLFYEGEQKAGINVFALDVTDRVRTRQQIERLGGTTTNV